MTKLPLNWFQICHILAPCDPGIRKVLEIMFTLPNSIWSSGVFIWIFLDNSTFLSGSWSAKKQRLGKSERITGSEC